MNKMSKDFFSKPLKVIDADALVPGDFVHDIADPSSLLDLEKRRGFVRSVKQESGQIKLRLQNRRTMLKLSPGVKALITRACHSEAENGRAYA
ncbi:MAG: hypothetical protein SWH54_00335 [Thermodesulfobacteriota bacterium]|nr:hypothetical protein [Thermodesulfobacteriota bacterium]